MSANLEILARGPGMLEGHNGFTSHLALRLSVEEVGQSDLTEAAS